MSSIRFSAEDGGSGGSYRSFRLAGLSAGLLERDEAPLCKHQLDLEDTKGVPERGKHPNMA